jgi:hypothetical protein
MIHKLCDAVDESLREYASTAEPKPVIRKDFLHNPAIEKDGKSLFYEGLLTELLTERRQMTKEERLSQYRNDSVDEVDTTEMEDYLDTFTGKRHPMEARAV